MHNFYNHNCSIKIQYRIAMQKLSVNINKIATLRNARGGNMPDVIQAAVNVERYGAHGITVHPRPDERHIRYNDCYELKKVVTTELNIEGYPDENFLNLINEVLPHQVTLVPDSPDVLTSNNGWDTVANKDFLRDIIRQLQSKGMRVSIFINPDVEMIEHAAATGTNRIELYTEAYAANYSLNAQDAIQPYVTAAKRASELNLGINAGHDLSLENLKFFANSIPQLLEVSIGHALISDALYYGLDNTVKMYKRLLNNPL